MICLQPSLPIPGKEAYLPEIGFWQVHDLLRGPSALHRSVREGKDGVALLEVLQSFPCLLHRPHWVIGPYFGMGKTFREAFDLQQSTQRNDNLTKVKVETVFRILLLRHFYHLSCISAQFGAPWTPTQWGQQVSEGSAKPRAVRLAVICQSGEGMRPRETPGLCGLETRIWTSLPTVRVRTRSQPYFLFGEQVFLLGRRRTTGRTKSPTISNSKIKLPCNWLDQAKRLIKAAKAGN